MFQGTGTALITPFDENLNVDYKALKKLVEFQVNNKVDFLVVLGTTGEAPVIDEDERKKIIDTVISKVDGKIPSGTTARSTAAARTRSSAAAPSCAARAGTRRSRCRFPCLRPFRSSPPAPS